MVTLGPLGVSRWVLPESEHVLLITARAGHTRQLCQPRSLAVSASFAGCHGPLARCVFGVPEQLQLTVAITDSGEKRRVSLRSASELTRS